MLFDFMEDVFGDLFENVTSGGSFTDNFTETVIAPMPEFDIGWDFEEDRPELTLKKRKLSDLEQY